MCIFLMIAFFIASLLITIREIRNAFEVDPKEPFLWDDFDEKKLKE